MKSLIPLGALGAALLCVPTAGADACRPPPGYSFGGHYQGQVYVPPLAVQLPLYGAIYAGDGADAQKTNELLETLIRKVDQLGQAVEKLQPAGPVGSVGLKADPVQVVRAHCAACHAAGVAEDKGGGFELFTEKGEPIPLSGPDRKAIAARVRNGTMPPAKAGRLTPADRDLVLAAIADPPKKDPAVPPAKK